MKKSFFSETRRELPFGFEPKTCWFVINCSIHLSYDSISWFLKSFNHFKLMGIKTNLKENGIFTAHRARTWGVFLRTVKLRNSRCRSRTDYFKIMTLAWYSVPLICKRHKEDSNLQVVSDRMVSNHLQYLYGIVACRRCVFTELSSPIKQVPWFFMCIPTTVLTFGYSLWLSASPQRYWVDFHP